MITPQNVDEMPEKGLRPPAWFNPSSCTMSLVGFSKKDGLLLLYSPHARIFVKHTKNIPLKDLRHVEGPGWNLYWRVQAASGISLRRFGWLFFSDEELAETFGLGLIEENGVTTCRPILTPCKIRGKCIRMGSFLNIPGPGVGEEDGTVSLRVSREVRNAVGELLSYSHV